jgi:hypothetical protein
MADPRSNHAKGDRGWVIVDIETRARYIQVVWVSQAEAQKELDLLLRGYPEDHEWRERLEVHSTSTATTRTQKSIGRGTTRTIETWAKAHASADRKRLTPKKRPVAEV